MFTGIVEEIGVVAGVDRARTGVCLRVKTSTVQSDAKIGDSIAVNGACLSIIDIKSNILNFDVMQETLKRTTLGDLKVGGHVNLEKSLRTDSKIGGHFVSGHIDYKGRIVDVLRGAEGAGFKISIPHEFSKFVIEKGSVAIDGVSLTVVDITREYFTVYLIPHTLKNTILGKKKKADPVNVEVDILARYLSRQTQKTNLQDLLKKYNYI